MCARRRPVPRTVANTSYGRWGVGHKCYPAHLRQEAQGPGLRMVDTATLGGRGGVRAPGSADFSAPKPVPARWAFRQQQRAPGIFSSSPSRGTCRSPASPPRRRYRRDAPWERGTPPIPLPPTAPVLDVNPVPLAGHGVHDAIKDVRRASVVQAGSPRVVDILRADLFSREADQVAEEHAVSGPLADLHLDPPVRHAPPNLPNLRDAYRPRKHEPMNSR